MAAGLLSRVLSVGGLPSFSSDDVISVAACPALVARWGTNKMIIRRDSLRDEELTSHKPVAVDSTQ